MGTNFPGDLTNGTKEGNVAFGTLTTISESKFNLDYFYTGSDDGKFMFQRWRRFLAIDFG